MKKSILLFCTVMMLVLSLNVAFAVHIGITAEDSATDGVNGFEELEGATNVAIFTVSDVPYAIVASYADDGVQIINLSDPANIVATDAETHGVNGFTALDGANDVATFTVSSIPYAIVTGYDVSGVQIINLSDPTDITAVDAEFDGANGFTELGAANDVATFTIGSTPYAIVVSEVDDGVQIINLSDPTDITAADNETDEVNGFTALDGVAGVATFTVSNVVYAIVTSIDDDGIQIININDPTDITAVDAEFDELNGFTKLDRIDNVDIFTSNNITYAIVSSAVEHGVQIINLSDPANIVAGDTATDEVDGFTQLESPFDIETFTSNNIPYAIVTDYTDDGVQIINLSDPANITPAGAATDEVDGFTELDAAYGVATFTVDGSLYAIVASEDDNGVQIISLPVHITSSGSGGCADCIPPTLGINKRGQSMVDNGFSFNGHYTNVEYFHTPFPLIPTQTGVNNIMTFKIYENHGIKDITNARVGLGMETKSTPIDKAEILFDILFLKGLVKDIEIKDTQFLIQNVTASSDATKCKESSNQEDCLEVTVNYNYRESPMYNIVAISPVDDNKNDWTVYFNDGIKVKGESLNPAKTAIVGGNFYTQLDKWQDTWVDKNGIEYDRNSNSGVMIRTTAGTDYECNDIPLGEINGAYGRENCHFRALTNIWD